MIMIESSGFADPSGMDTLIALALRKAGLNETEVCALSVADPLTFMKLIGSMAMLRRQIEVADTILINKADLSDQETLDKLSKTMRLMNPQALITIGSFGMIDKDLLKTHLVTKDQTGDKVAKKDLFNTSLTVRVKAWKDEQSVLDFLSEIQPCLFRLKGTVQVGDADYQIEIASGRSTMVPCEHSDGLLTLLYSQRLNDSDKLHEVLRKVTVTDPERSP
jgi:G3E family GTPase